MDSAKLNITINQAAKELGKSPQFVRVALQNGVAPFGFATKVSGDKYDYHISPKLLREYIGDEAHETDFSELPYKAGA